MNQMHNDEKKIQCKQFSLLYSHLP